MSTNTAVSLTSNFQHALPTRATSRVTSLGISSFWIEQFERAELRTVLEKVISLEPISREEALNLFHVRLPFLGKLVELQESVRGGQSQTKKFVLRPVVYLPLSRMLDHDGPELALQNAVTAINASFDNVSLANWCLAGWHRDSSRFYFAIDRWTSKRPLSELLTLVAKLRDVFGNERIVPIGPSAAEIRELAIPETSTAYENLTPEIREKVISILEQFFNEGVDRIEGGIDLSILQTAARFGFRFSVGQELHADRDPTTQKILPTTFADNFVDDLFHIRRSLGESSAWTTWFPWTSSALDSLDAVDQPLGLTLLRCISVGRLILPTLTRIRAPLSLMGMKAAHVALYYGANDLGYAALNSETAQALGILPLSSVSDVLFPQNAESSLEWEL